MNNYVANSLHSNTEMKAFFRSQKDTDKWLQIFSKEAEVVPMPYNGFEALKPQTVSRPLKFLNAFGNEVNGFADEVTSEDVAQGMNEAKMAIVIPRGNSLKMYPLFGTATKHLQDRSGIGGTALSALKDRNNAYELSPDVKANIFNNCLSVRRDMTKVLIRNNMVIGLLSGDEKDYAVMPVIDLVTVLEGELEKSYSKYNYISGEYSVQMSRLLYSLEDEGIKKQMVKTLSAANVNVGANDIKVAIQLTTSDVGLSAAKLTPIVTCGKQILPCGKAIAVEHKGSTAISRFIDETHRIMAKYKVVSMYFERMLNCNVKYPSDCLYNIITEGVKLNGYASVLKQTMERLTNEVKSCTGFDIYYYACELINAGKTSALSRDKEVSLFDEIKAQETISEILFLNISDYDYPAFA